MSKRKVLIIGGGASGMLAAIIAKRQGAEVVILERNPRVGKKILATGNGRCNFTNINAGVDHYYGNNPKFIDGALSWLSVRQTIGFFEELGIAHKVEDAGKVFPMSDQASSVLDVLLHELGRTGIEVICNAYVKRMIKRGTVFSLELEDGSSIAGDRIIIATGGKAMPSSGSDGNGFQLVGEMGHSVVPIFPSLVQIMLEGNFFKQIKGVKLIGTAKLLKDGKLLTQDRGDILFANYGVSGPPILQISRRAGELLQKGETAVLSISILDKMSEDQIKSSLAKRFGRDNGKSVEASMVGLINKRLIPVILREAKIENPRDPARNLTGKQIDTIAGILKDWRLKIRGTKGWQSAQATAGGIDTNEVDPYTMESKLVEGLFFAGEVLDIDGKCGGFNLQWAWSSGYTAGYNASLP
ncbi:MAG: NAD(P)/FAD-dependent oxidoreductase [Clostridiales bacterium]|nr:NAD(P)/FAD-dependent oxidoreductase [Clostridiales bacterium]